MVTQVQPDQAIKDDDVAPSEVTVTLTLSANQWRRIEETAAGYGISTHDLLRIGLDEFLDGPGIISWERYKAASSVSSAG